MRAREVYEHLRGMDGGWVRWDDTVDTFKAGDPNTEVRGIAVCWMSYVHALQEAEARGCNLVITHEPTFYSHRDNDESVFQYTAVRAKRDYIRTHGLVVLRCHDLWDQYPGMGIPDSWAEFLGFDSPLVTEGYYRVFDVSGETAGALARRVAARTAARNQTSVQLIGSPTQNVSRLALGAGALTPLRHFLDAYACDMAICTDDGFTYWRDGALALDLGIPVVIVNHAVSEVSGMQKLAEHLRQVFPTTRVEYLAQGCMFQTVSGT